MSSILLRDEGRREFDQFRESPPKPESQMPEEALDVHTHLVRVRDENSQTNGFSGP